MNLSGRQDPVYTYIGQRIRNRRKLLKLNQTELAGLMGFSYQQMQKYEAGTSHVSAGKLLLFAKILNVPPSYFYEGLRLDEAIGKRIDSHIIQRVRTRPLRILLVENNPADVILFRNALGLREELIDLDVVHDPEMALTLLHNGQAVCQQKWPDLIVLDLSLPKLSGLELLKALKKHPKTTSLPVVVLTNSINVKDMMSAYKYGAAGFMQKSVDLDEYVESVETAIKYWSKAVVLPVAA